MKTEKALKTAWFVKECNWGYDVRLYRVGRRYVVVSAVDVPFSGPETYIFQADRDGKVLDWLELPGSFRGALNHARALRGAGCKIRQPK